MFLHSTTQITKYIPCLLVYLTRKRIASPANSSPSISLPVSLSELVFETRGSLHNRPARQMNMVGNSMPTGTALLPRTAVSAFVYIRTPTLQKVTSTGSFRGIRSLFLARGHEAPNFILSNPRLSYPLIPSGFPNVVLLFSFMLSSTRLRIWHSFCCTIVARSRKAAS